MGFKKLAALVRLAAAQTLVRYAFVGGSIAFADVIMFYILAVLLGFNYLIVNAMGFVIGTFANYLLSIRFVFCSGARFQRSQEISLVYLVSFIGLFLNQTLIYGFSEVIEMNLMAAKLATVASVFLWNYTVRRYGIFSTTKRKFNQGSFGE